MPFWRRQYKLKLSGTSQVPQSDSPAGNGQTLKPQAPPSGLPLGLADQLRFIQDELKNCSDIIFHPFTLSGEVSCVIIYLQGMVDQQTIRDNLMNGLIQWSTSRYFTREEIYTKVFDENLLSVARSNLITDQEQAVNAILSSSILLVAEGDSRMLEIPAASYQNRAIAEAPNESVIRGPREAFIEDLDINLTLVRRRLKSKDFKTEAYVFGDKTQTRVILGYMEGVCHQELLAEVKNRLSFMNMDGVLGSSYLEECIEDNPYSPFPQLQYTERPDVVAAAILEGRFALLVDGSPMAIMAPVSLGMLMQSAEDYYQKYIAATWIRWIRYIFFVVSLMLPSVYIAITTFHPEMIPSRLLYTVAASREIVPFPALMEALMMEVAFEALREASVRIPKSIGQAVSIIGALIIGTAAVQAGIASAAMVIIVSLTGIASFIIPHFDLGLAFRLLRFPIMILASFMGLFGLACGLILIYVHLLSLKSFGLPYMSPLAPLIRGDIKDTLVRAPWWAMIKRPALQTRNNTRQTNTARDWELAKEENRD